ncbi:MAG: DUF3106 domain-containing protein [Verrucomicrobiota bacterium]|nr:DUF3106 domain-containing protein [Verrucomicrobiota bacterium]
MKLRVTVIRLALPTMLAMSAAAGALGAESPFAAFKKIVSLPEASRGVAVSKLKISSERYRKIVEAKIQEYAAMTEAERNRKLDALDFRWHLMPFMKAPQAGRAKRLASVPERFRTDIERRLTGWDQLDDGVRADLLKNESFFRYISSFGRGRESRVALTNHIKKMPIRLREGLEGRLKDWRDKPKPERRRMTRQFHRFFDMPVAEQERALRSLSGRERARMEASLTQFKAMSRAQRELVIKSFDRLASKSQSERAAFFRNTERWNGMSEDERKKWRTLVTQMPPLPPGFGDEARPPLPPGLVDETVPVQTVVTNTIR